MRPSDLRLYCQLAVLVAGGNRLGSFLAMFRKARVNDDLGRRGLEKLQMEFHNDPLIQMKDGRLVFTAVGRKVWESAVPLLALADNTEPPPDVLTMEFDSFLAQALLPRAFANFFDLWGSVVQAKVVPLQNDLVRRNIQEGATSFAVAFSDGMEPVGAAEALGPKVPWILCVAKDNHRFAGSSDPVTAESMSSNQRVFLPDVAMAWPGMDEFLKSVPSHNRIECDGTFAVNLAMSGLGVALVPDMLDESNSFHKIHVLGVENLQPRLVLPRKGMEGLTEPEQCLVEEIRKVAEARCEQAIREAETDAEDVALALLEETVTPAEGVLS